MTNLLQNPGFENGITSWTPVLDAQARSTPVRSGSGSAVLFHGPFGADTAIYQDVSFAGSGLSVGDEFELSVYWATDTYSSNPHPFGVAVQWINSSNGLFGLPAETIDDISPNPPNVGLTDWEQVKLLTTIPSGAVGARAVIRFVAPPTTIDAAVYLDDAYMGAPFVEPSGSYPIINFTPVTRIIV